MTQTSSVLTILAGIGLTVGVAADELSPPDPAVQHTLSTLAHAPSTPDAAQPDLALAADATLAVRQAPDSRVCDPAVIDNRAKLDPGCINRIVNLGVRKGRYRAQSRDKRELRSLCENTFLPRCRHKY